MKIIVVGAGITGISTAEWLRRDGREVTLIDRVRPGDPGQASYGNAGMVSASGVVPVSVPGLVWKAPGMLLDPDSPLYLRWTTCRGSSPGWPGSCGTGGRAGSSRSPAAWRR